MVLRILISEEKSLLDWKWIRISMVIQNSKYVLLMVIAAANFLQCQGQEKPTRVGERSLTWSEFISVEGRFRVLMPDKPKLEVLTYELGKSRLVHNTFTVERGAFIWLVDYADLSSEIDSTDPAAFFNEARDQLVRELNGTLQQQKSLTLGRHSGLDIKLRISGGEARVRLYLVNNRLYQLLVTRLDLLSKSQESMEKFLNSFKIINEQTPHTAIRHRDSWFFDSFCQLHH
jgi:hypothetical protein